MIACAAFDEARRSGKFAVYAYVVMPDHVHVVTDSAISPAKTLRFINGISAHRIIEYLKANCFEKALKKLQHALSRKQHKYSVWNHHPDVRLLLTEAMLMQRVTYTHQNPVRANLVSQPLDYRWSSVRCWAGRVLEDEPLIMDLERINWRRSLNK